MNITHRKKKHTVACQAQPALVKIGPVFVLFFITTFCGLNKKRIVSRRGLEDWQFVGDPAPLACVNMFADWVHLHLMNPGLYGSHAHCLANDVCLYLRIDIFAFQTPQQLPTWDEVSRSNFFWSLSPPSKGALPCLCACFSWLFSNEIDRWLKLKMVKCDSNRSH